MESGWYELKSGRQVWLQQLLIRLAALDIYMGKKEEVRRHVLEQLPEDVRRLCGENMGLVVIEPSPETLPKYVLIAEFLSPTPVHQDFDCSSLAVCWFSDSLSVDPEMVGEQVRSVAWEAEAKDGYY